MANETFRHRLSWEEKAKQNPLFAVMSAEQFADKSSNPEDWSAEDLEVFFAKGQFMFDNFLRPVLDRIPLNPGNTFIVEYGSGMGRILRAVKAAGYECAGIDISPTMLGYSRKIVPEVTRLSLLDEHGHCDIPDASADFIYSYAVIQHIHVLSNVRSAIAEMCRILKPGGIVKLQFRTLDPPFRRLNSRDRTWVYNFEHRSFVLSGLIPSLTKHTSWVGVPLSCRNLQRFLNDGGCDLIGIEGDVGQKKNMAWAVARKES
ncbi:MAG: class I SAM-dependent methyltransferase [Nitrospirae bacterium]|nr:class I SAM-dependent methyltransferase [Nitrospirota bacterium]